VLAALDLAERLEGAPDPVRAVEGRTSTDELRAALAAGGLPRSDTSVLGAAFAAELGGWLDALAAAIAPQG
jgi:hypothetical protein